MATSTDAGSTLAELLRDLMELDFDAIEAYRAAIERLENTEYRQKLLDFMTDHERHTQEIGAILEEMGESPPEEGDMKAALTKGKVVLGGLVGDRSILSAMRSNEEETNTAYERAVDHQQVNGKARDVLSRGLTDERRHRQWLITELEAARPPT